MITPIHRSLIKLHFLISSFVCGYIFYINVYPYFGKLLIVHLVDGDFPLYSDPTMKLFGVMAGILIGVGGLVGGIVGGLLPKISLGITLGFFVASYISLVGHSNYSEVRFI